MEDIIDLDFQIDQPVNTESEDKFQRYDFSKRVAQLILKQKGSNSFVVGLTGSWGEGKTSVMNFIENEIRKDNSTYVIKFNPWIFENESTLMISFFRIISQTLKKTKNFTKEKIGKLLSDYSFFLSPISLLSPIDFKELSNQIGRKLSNSDISTIKEKVNDFLSNLNSKLVIFIDDIDRLDKDEIYSLLKLVKLNADFKNTVYVLAYDEVMVANAINEKFGSDNNSGNKYLEKLVQLPIKIPSIQYSLIRKFYFDRVYEILKKNQVILDEMDKYYFDKLYNDVFIEIIKTPRSIIRYTQNIDFILPLVAGEVDIIDFFVIELIRLFFPIHYNAIRNNKDLIIKRKNRSGNHDDNRLYNSQMGKIFSEADSYLKGFSITIDILLDILFPGLNRSNFNTFSRNSTENSKRIYNPDYYNKYFTLSLPNDEVPDSRIHSFLTCLNECDIEDLCQRISEIVYNFSSDSFVTKLFKSEQLIKVSSIEKLVKSLTKSGDLFYQGNSVSNFLPNYTLERLSVFVIHLLKSENKIENKFDFLKLLLIEARPFILSYYVYIFSYNEDRNVISIINKEQYNELFKIIKNRCLEESEEIPIFEKFPYQSDLIMNLWSTIDNKDEFDEYIRKIIICSPEKTVKLIRAFLPYSLGSDNMPYTHHFERDSFKWIKSLFDIDLLFDCLKKSYGEDIITEIYPIEQSFRLERIEYSDNLIAKIFVFYYLDDKKKLNEQ